MTEAEETEAEETEAESQTVASLERKEAPSRKFLPVMDGRESDQKVEDCQSRDGVCGTVRVRRGDPERESVREAGRLKILERESEREAG